MSFVKKLFSDTLFYGISSILGRIANYLLTIIYTAVFLPHHFGIITELYAYAAFFNIIYLWGFETAFFRFSKKESVADTFNMMQTYLVVSALILSVFLFLSSNLITTALAYDSTLYVWILALIFFNDTQVALPYCRLRQMGAARRFALYKLATVFLNIVFNLVLLLTPYFTRLLDPVVSVLVANLLSNILVSMFLRQAWVWRWQWNGAKIRSYIVYALPLVIAGIGGMVNEMASRAFLRFWLPSHWHAELTNQEVVGIFGACYKLSILIVLVNQAFKYAVEPLLFQKMNTQEGNRQQVQITHLYVAFGSTLLLLIGLNVDVLAWIFLRNPVYHLALDSVPYLLLGGLLLGIYFQVSFWYKTEDRTYWAVIISVIGAMITLLGNYFLIPRFGYMGSAYTVVITYCCMVIMAYVIGQLFKRLAYSSYYLLYPLLTVTVVILLNGMAVTVLQVSLRILLLLMAGLWLWMVELRKVR